MFRPVALTLLAVLAVALAAPDASAARQTPERGDRAPAPGADAVRLVASDRLDVDEMAMRVVGDRHWATFTPAQRQDVLAQLRPFLHRAHAQHQRQLLQAGATWAAGAERGGRIDVRAQAGTGKTRPPITYQLEKQSGAWVVTNMVSDGVSKVDSLNRTVARVLSRGDGVAGLLILLREVNAAEERP